MVCSVGTGQRIHQYYEVCLDNGSQVNIVDPRLLTDLRASTKVFRGMSGEAQTLHVGYLQGFFECQACNSYPTNVLSMSDVEDIYPVTYVQGKSITVHMDHRDVIFTKRDKMYVADFSDWVVGEQQQVGALKTELSLMTVSEREGMYQRKDIPRALEAGEFLKSLGYPTQSEALRIVSDGNVMNVPYTLADIKRFFDIYGAQVPGLRGKTTKRHVSRHRTEDAMAKL
jgi:hypothetical protein